MKLQHILVPVDLQSDSSYAARYGLSIAHLFDTKLTLLHVAAWQAVGVVAVEPMYMPQGLVTRLEAERMQIIGDKLAALRDELAAQRNDRDFVEVAIKRGFTAEGIAEYAAENAVDLIVMESRSTLGGGFYLGGTADKVSRMASCPVLISPPDATDERPTLKKALVTIDYSAFSVPAARFACEMVGAGGEVELIHVWQAPFIPAIDANLSNVAEELREAIEKQRGAQAEGLIKIAEQLDYPGVKISNYIAEGSPAKEILERAKQSKPDMVVLGSHSRERLSERVRGTVADRVLRHANTSVLMLPAGAIDGDS